MSLFESPAVADESALEWYFDHFIANDSLKTETGDVKGDQDDELFFSLLPDELLTPDADSSTKPDHNSHNSTAAAELPGGSSEALMSVTAQPEIIPQISNVVSTVKLGCRLDLNFIACKAWNIEYKPKTYCSLIMRIREPRATAAIYKSGNVVCTGAKSVAESRLAARKFARILQKLGFPVCFLNFQVHNIQASCSTFPVRLEQLARHHLRHCSYEPELFPGLHYKGLPGITVTIFSSGKISFIGAKKEAEIHKAFSIIYPILSSFRSIKPDWSIGSSQK